MINTKKIAALTLAAASLATAPVTAFAAEATESAPVATTGVNAPKSEVPVTLKVEANYTVDVPAAIVLEYETEGQFVEDEPVYAADYDITVKGVVPGAMALRVTGDNVEMQDKANEATKFTVENYMNSKDATEQALTFDVAGSDVTAEGFTVANRLEHSADGIGQGDYEGIADFSYKLVSAQ